MTHFFSPDRIAMGVGIEDTFIPQERVGHRKLDEYELTQHYQYWREDLNLAREAGAEFIRWGIPWFQVEPRPGEFDFSWIDEVAAHMQEIGLHCVVDLLHYGTPLWLDNSFINAKYPEYFARYAGAVAERYRGVFTSFTPANEPLVNAQWCGRDGGWPPYLTGEDGFVKVVTAVAEGMSRAQEAIHAVAPEAEIVFVDAGFRYAGDHFPGHSREHLEEWRFIATDLVLGRVDEEHSLFGHLREHGVTDEKLAWFRENAKTPDVMGVNYYPGFTTLSFDSDGAEVPGEGGVEGLVELVRAYHERYGFPIAITETSRNESPEAKIQWLQQSLAALEELRADGVLITGYTWFPFFSLIDWLYRYDTDSADNHWNHLGLLELRRTAGGVLERVPNAALGAFSDVANRAAHTV
ncbi:family 1 glycosylhydrolase [Ruania alba]|uniref:Beta-glucosidase/6-phospho-beta-glucosidase/beta-galactosidase n=1 Tax=Ruania alba TaxID=648782 RepID=A0A1H5GYP3_9MICO|nr:family 1 glycosylhydrolase [Ruania alba]SEE20770.1 Beta-glucosidase/6-phospho-beta-glucosidase/beta-galactosidase [Ruania alba]